MCPLLRKSGKKHPVFPITCNVYQPRNTSYASTEKYKWKLAEEAAFVKSARDFHSICQKFFKRTRKAPDCSFNVRQFYRCLKNKFKSSQKISVTVDKDNSDYWRFSDRRTLLKASVEFPGRRAPFNRTSPRDAKVVCNSRPECGVYLQCH